MASVWRGACGLLLQGAGRGVGTAGAKGLSPAAPAVPAQRRRPGGWKTALRAHLGSSCRARASAARTGHVAQGRPALQPARPRLPPGRGSRERAGHEHASTRMYSAVWTHMHTSLGPRTAAASGGRPPGFQATSQLCDLKQVTQPLWASAASAGKGTYRLLPVAGEYWELRLIGSLCPEARRPEERSDWERLTG